MTTHDDRLQQFEAAIGREATTYERNLLTGEGVTAHDDLATTRPPARCANPAYDMQANPHWKGTTA